MLRDHLGNARSGFRHTATGTASLRSDHYPFGLQYPKDVLAGSPKNRYLYNGKELQDGLGLYDYGARLYDPVIGRWNAVDPMAEVHFNVNPYNYVLNNPISYIDLFGLDTLGYNELTDEQWKTFDTNEDVLEINTIMLDANQNNGVQSTSSFRPGGELRSERPRRRLTFVKAQRWYQFANGAPININLNSIDFSNVSLKDVNPKTGLLTVRLLGRHLSNINDALIHGTITLQQIDGTTNQFEAAYNKEVNGLGGMYNFEMHSLSDFSSWIRNPLTFFGEVVNGLMPFGGTVVYVGGTPFPIYYDGTVTIKP